MKERRVLQLVRVILGVFLVWRSWEILGSPQHAAESLAQTASWSGWPLIGHLRPLELTFTVAFTLFFLGVFLAGGLLVRILGLAVLLIAIASFAIFGAHSWPSHLFVLVMSLVVTLRGGGAGTMDAALGAMQRRSLEREAEREAARRAERAEAENATRQSA